MRYLFVLLPALACAFVAASIARDRRNVLAHYPAFQSRKAELALGVNGAQSFLLSPLSLAGRALNLAAWHGHQELMLRDVWKGFPALSLKFRAQGSAELSVFARPLAEGSELGFRLSSRSGRASAVLELGPEREILHRTELPAAIEPGRWHLLELRPGSAGLQLRLDSSPLHARPLPAGDWLISLQGDSSAGRLEIDELELRAEGRSYRESFSGSFPFPLFAAVAAVSALLLLLLERLLPPRRRATRALLLSSLGGAVLLLWELGLSRRYPSELPALAERSSRIESAAEAMRRLEALDPRDQRPVIAWAGGSQAWGAGASEAGRSVFGRLQAALPPVLARRFQLVNAAVSGARIRDQQRALAAIPSSRRIAAVALTAGVNDAENAAALDELSALQAWLQARGSSLWLLEEPVETPSGEALRRRREELRHFAAERGIPHLPLQELLDRARDQGYLWWDFVHLSDRGAAIAAAEVTPFVIRQLEQLRGSTDARREPTRRREEPLPPPARP